MSKITLERKLKNPSEQFNRFIQDGIDGLVEKLYDNMFLKYYGGNELSGWCREYFFGGGNANKYKELIKKLLLEGKDVKTGYYTSRIRGSKEYYVFHK